MLVGDRGMISKASIAELAGRSFGLDHGAEERTDPCPVDDGAAAAGLFDERNLFELSHPDFPGERLVACRNPDSRNCVRTSATR